MLKIWPLIKGIDIATPKEEGPTLIVLDDRS